MKTFKQFQEETRQLDEIAPALAIAGKVVGAGLAAYSAYDAAKQFKKGNYGRSALSALGAIPGAGIFKGAKFLSKSNKIAKGVKGLSSVNKFVGPGGRDAAFNALSKTKVANNKPNNNRQIASTKDESKPKNMLSRSDFTRVSDLKKNSSKKQTA